MSEITTRKCDICKKLQIVGGEQGWLRFRPRTIIEVTPSPTGGQVSELKQLNVEDACSLTCLNTGLGVR